MITMPYTRRFSVEEYYRMSEAGIFAPDERLELLEGQIIPMSPIGTFHSSVGIRLQTLFTLAGGERWIVWSQYPISLSDGSEPQPDLALVKPRADFYRQKHPQPADIYLLVEVADSSVRFDREQKLPVYARAGIKEYWIVNLVEKLIETYREPSPLGTYATGAKMRGEAQIAPEAFPDTVIRVSDLLETGA